MKRTRIPDLFYWGVYQPDRHIDFNGFYWRRESGGVLIDPMPLDAEQLECVDAPVRWILLTNADHARAAADLRERLGAELVAPESDRAALADLPVDRWYGESTQLPDELAADIAVHWIRGGKTPAEASLYLVPLRAIVFGDIVRSHDSGTLRILPDQKIRDRARVIEDLHELGELDVEAVLLGDGDPLFTGARRAYADLMAALS